MLGLGNPGASYAASRHNLGFRVVEELARRRHVALDGWSCNCRLGRLPGVALAQPQTYMNRSGWAARCLVELDGFRPEDILVVYDEMALPLGRLRLRPRGGPGGHRGIESVLQNLRTDEVPRLRCGIGGDGSPAPEGWSEWVLEPFTAAEEAVVAAMVGRAADACEEWIEAGTEAAMNRFNG